MPSPITPFEFRGNFYHIKRDDLLRPFEGNKARKFYYFLKNDFPHIKKLISFGSNQSNAMYAMSELCKIKGWEFIYYTHHIPSFLKQNPHGNYLKALQNGAKIIEVGLRGDCLREFVLKFKDDDTLVIEEGGRVRESEEGIKILADEINEYCLKNSLKVFLPSGTGTTAYFLAKHLDVEVITTPCVGDREYLKKQFELLGGGKAPTIISPKRKYHFGKLYKHLYLLWQELKEAGVEFDLLYDPIGWEVVLENRLFDVLYIHQGGLYGNESMLRRYKRRFDIML
jgi:1-aminocyclopropane-1-carboxylate deaminase/D-cysteine desulfhydrase-like pyridoxal-dependent ACC family enzyme